MQQLYKKSEIWFAVAWIIAYVVGASVADNLSAAVGIGKIVTLPFLLLLSVVALQWIRKNGLQCRYGLCKPSLPAGKFLYYLPLAFLASCNLWHGACLNLPVPETILYMGSMLCVGFLEEVIFRGFLFRAMEKDSLKWAVIVSSITFGLGHIINLFNGSGANLLSNLCQVFSAIAFGFLFVILFYRGGSLLPCILCHSTLNALSAFANETAQTDAVQILVSAVLAGTAIVYTLILCKTLPENPQ